MRVKIYFSWAILVFIAFLSASRVPCSSFDNQINDFDTKVSGDKMFDFVEEFQMAKEDHRHEKPASHAKDTDPNSEASDLALEAGPSAMIAGCVNVISGEYADVGIDLAVPGLEAFAIHHTFRDFYKIALSHQLSLRVGYSTHENAIIGAYTDEFGSTLPYRGHLRHGEPLNGMMRLTEHTKEHLTNCSHGEISGKTRWANSKMHFVRKGDTKQYHLILGSGVKRIFERKDEEPSAHRSGASTGNFHIVKEERPNGISLRYSYDKDELTKVRAVNSKGDPLVELKRDCHGAIVWSIGSMKVEYFKDGNCVSIYPSHGITTTFKECSHGIDKIVGNKHALRVRFVDDVGTRRDSRKVESLLAPVGHDDSLIPIYTFSYDPKVTRVKNAKNEMTQYEYSEKCKHFDAITVYDKEGKPYCKERFYWNKPSGQSSEYLLVAKTLKEGHHLHFGKQMEYDHFGNITKYRLWGRLTGKECASLVMK